MEERNQVGFSRHGIKFMRMRESTSKAVPAVEGTQETSRSTGVSIAIVVDDQGIEVTSCRARGSPSLGKLSPAVLRRGAPCVGLKTTVLNK